MSAPRKILHLDLDAFFCAVEELRDPSLAGQPFAVGGQPQERGVVSSCSYAARRLGVHSAMPMSQALRLCPRLRVLPPRHDDYTRYSHQVMQRLENLTPLVEQISIDEAFLDISDLPEPAEEIARRLQAQIHEEIGLPCSLGVAPNKLLAKIANDVGKSAAVQSGAVGPPNAITHVPAGKEAEFLAPLPVERLWGVGPKTAARLEHDLDVHTIGDLAALSPDELAHRYGKHGQALAAHACGVDDSPVIVFHEPRSYSQETTFVTDLRDEIELRRTLHGLAEGVGRRLRHEGYVAATVKLKLRRADFTTFTRQMTLAVPTDLDRDLFAAALLLFEKAWRPGTLIRLLGVGASGLSRSASPGAPSPRQLSLWDSLASSESSASTEEARRLQTAIDELRDRFGDDAIRRASDLEPIV